MTIENDVEELKKNKAIRDALDKTSGRKKHLKQKITITQKIHFGVYILFILAFSFFFYLLRLRIIDFPPTYLPLLQRLLVGGMILFIILTISNALKVFFISPLADEVAQFNLKHILNLLVGLAIFFIVLSIIFANWYTTVVSLGLISVLLGFALQNPITSFIGWVYILVKKPYSIGDRIKIGEATGDVIDVSYLDTTLWEFGGQYLSSDHPSGRIIKFPNSHVLISPVYNYSWPLFPYLWNEVKFHIAYQSDFAFVSDIMQKIAMEEVGEAMSEHVKTYCKLLSQTPVDELEVQQNPIVFFRVSENTWIEATVRYLVEPKRAALVKNRLITRMLESLNKEPEKVMFPKSDMR